MTPNEKLRYEYFIETGIVWMDTNDNVEIDYVKWLENKQLALCSVGSMFSAKQMEQAFNDGAKAEQDRCGDFDIKNYR